MRNYHSSYELSRLYKIPVKICILLKSVNVMLIRPRTDSTYKILGLCTNSVFHIDLSILVTDLKSPSENTTRKKKKNNMSESQSL
jgi:hypothetical protein